MNITDFISALAHALGSLHYYQQKKSEDLEASSDSPSEVKKHVKKDEKKYSIQKIISKNPVNVFGRMVSYFGLIVFLNMREAHIINFSWL